MPSSANQRSGLLSTGQARTSSNNGSRVMNASPSDHGGGGGESGDEGLDVGHMGGAERRRRCLDVEPQQWLGVGRAHVVPPVVVFDRQSIEQINGCAGQTFVGGDRLDRG